MEQEGRSELFNRLAVVGKAFASARRLEIIAGHLPGAVSIPFGELTGRLAELPVGTEIVAYCRGAYCVMG